MPDSLDQNEFSLLSAAVEAIRMSFIIADHTAEDDPIIFCNQAFEKLTGYRQDEVLGRNCRFLQGSERDQPNLAIIRDAVRHGKDATVTLLNFRKDGSPFYNELNISPVHASDGSVTHLIGIQQEVKPFISEKNAEIFHHEWRTPLTIIRSTLQLLQQKGMAVDTDFLNQSLQAAVRAIDRLEQIGRAVPKK